MSHERQWIWVSRNSSGPFHLLLWGNLGSSVADPMQTLCELLLLSLDILQNTLHLDHQIMVLPSCPSYTFTGDFLSFHQLFEQCPGVLVFRLLNLTNTWSGSKGFGGELSVRDFFLMLWFLLWWCLACSQIKLWMRRQFWSFSQLKFNEPELG